IDTIRPLGFYLGIFPFFYGILLLPKFNESVWKALIIVLFILPFLKFMPGVDMNIRAYWFSFPLFFTLIGARLIYPKFFKLDTFIIWFAGSFLIITAGIGILGLKFTLIFSGLVALVCLILSIRKSTAFLYLFTRPHVIVFAILFVSGIITGI